MKSLFFQCLKMFGNGQFFCQGCCSLCLPTCYCRVFLCLLLFCCNQLFFAVKIIFLIFQIIFQEDSSIRILINVIVKNIDIRCLLFLYFVMLISLINWQQKLVTGIRSVLMSLLSFVAPVASIGKQICILFGFV